MTWASQRLTSILYGAASGVTVSTLTHTEPALLIAPFVGLGILTELYRGELKRRGDD